ncbi:MAG: RNA methyltransferase, partial [Pseudobdellovibrio sp.]
MARFFVSCPLGFETSLATEIKNFWFEMIDLDGLPTRAEFPELEILQGGVEFETDDHLGFQINFFSKLANRVLLRIAKFESRYYDQFEKELSKIDLEKYLDFDYLNHQLQVKIESHKSRLNNEKNLNEAFSHVLDKKKIKISDKARQTLFIRIEKDRVTVSLDTSGEHLHRRGYASHRGEAPLRETLAAYLVTHLNLSSRLRLIDPFAG